MAECLWHVHLVCSQILLENSSSLKLTECSVTLGINPNKKPWILCNLKYCTLSFINRQVPKIVRYLRSILHFMGREVMEIVVRGIFHSEMELALQWEATWRKKQMFFWWMLIFSCDHLGSCKGGHYIKFCSNSERQRTCAKRQMCFVTGIWSSLCPLYAFELV